MCPACLATVGLLAGAVSSAGVAAAYLFEKLRKDKAMNPLGRNEKDLPQTMSSVRQVPGL
jgi:hypothetical protein